MIKPASSLFFRMNYLLVVSLLWLALFKLTNADAASDAATFLMPHHQRHQEKTTQTTETAQKKGQNDYQGHWWLNIGAGAGFYNNNGDFNSNNDDNDGFPSYLFSFDYIIKPKQLLSLRTYQVVNYGAMTFGVNRTQLSDVGLLYGLINKGYHGYTAVSAGLALVREVGYCGSSIDDGVITSECQTKHTVGLPLQAEAFWTPLKHTGVGGVGLGMILAGDVNGDHPFGSILLAIQMGNLK